MLVMAHRAHEVPHVVQVRRRFQQLSTSRGQPVQRLERGEEQVGNVRHFAGMFQRDAVAPSHIFHFAPLVAAQAGEFGAHVARRQVGDDAVAHSGARVVERRQVKLLQELEQHAHARHDDLRAPRADPGNLAPLREAQSGDPQVEPAHLRRRDAQPVDLFALGAWRPRHHGRHRAGRRRGSDDAIPSGVPQPPQRRVQLGLDVFVHLVDLPRVRRIVLEERRVQPDRAEWFRVRIEKVPAAGGDDLGAAAADIDHQYPLVALRPDTLHAQMNQARFLAARNDLYGRPRRFPRARQELALIARVANRTGGHRADAYHVQLTVDPGHARQHQAGGPQGFFADRTVADHALAQAGDLAVARQHTRRQARHHFGGFHADGVAADIDGGVAGHASILSGGVQQRGYDSAESTAIVCRGVHRREQVLAPRTQLRSFVPKITPNVTGGASQTHFYAALVLTVKPGLLDGFIRISTSIPVSRANCSSFSSENFPSRPRARSDTRGCAILRRAPAWTWFSPRSVRIRFTRRAISALANASSGLGRPISANTLPLPSSTCILLGMFVYSSLSIMALKCNSASASRLRISSKSRFGVLIPALDFF